MGYKKSKVNLTKDEYKSLKPGSTTKLKFEFYDPALLGMQGIFRTTTDRNGKFDVEEFKITITCELYMNHLQRYDMQTQGVHKLNWIDFNWYYTKMAVWELAMEGFHYDLGFSFITYSDEQYEKYINHIQPEVNSLSKSRMKALILATDYLKFVDFFEYKMAMVWLANKDYLTKGLKHYLSFYDVPKDEVKKRTDVMRTTVGRIPSDLLIKAGRKGTIGGTLSDLARNNIFHYVQANYKSSNLEDYLASVIYSREINSNG